MAQFGGEEGHPATDSPTALYFNPAGIALGRGTRLYADGVFAYRSLTYVRPQGAIDNPAPASGPGTPADAISSNSGKATLANPVAAPFLGVVSDLGVQNLGVGVAFYVPFGGAASWDQNPAFRGNTKYPGAVDGVQRWSIIDGTLQSAYVTAGGAYYFPSLHLAAGLGLNIVLSSIDTVRARNANATDDVSTASGAVQEGRSLLEVSGTQVALGGGLIWEPTSTLRLGISYQSQPGFGEMSLGGTLTNKFGQGAASPTSVTLFQSLPDVLRVGARLRPTPRTELRLSGEYVRWSVFQRQCALEMSTLSAGCKLGPNGNQLPGSGTVSFNLERDWKDTFGVRGGGSYWVTPGVELQLGAGWDGNAVPDQTIDASLLDQNKLIFVAGARFELDRSWMLAATFMQFVFLERTVAPRARDAMGAPITLDLPTRVPDGAGTYSQSASVLDLSLQYTF